MKTPRLLFAMMIGAALMVGASYAAASDPAPVQQPSENHRQAEDGRLSNENVRGRETGAAQMDAGHRVPTGDGDVRGLRGRELGAQRLIGGTDAHGLARAPNAFGVACPSRTSRISPFNRGSAVPSTALRAGADSRYSSRQPTAIIGGVAKPNAGSTAAINGAEMTRKR